MNQGDIYWYAFQPPDKRRPVLILTRNSAIPFLTSITVAPITTNVRSIPAEVFLSLDDGVVTECAANLDNIQTVPKSKLTSYITHLSQNRMREVCDAVRFALGFDAFQ